MKIGGTYGGSQHPSIGLKQGCPLSATLFGLFTDGLHQYLQDTVPEAGVQVQHLRLTDLKYADDVCLMAPTKEHLQALLDALYAHCGMIGMTVSQEKTKIMVLLLLYQHSSVTMVQSFGKCHLSNAWAAFS